MIRKALASLLVAAALLLVPAVAGPTIAESVPAAEAIVPTAQAHSRISGNGPIWKCWPASTKYRGSGCGWYSYGRSGDLDPRWNVHENKYSWIRLLGVGPTYVERFVVHYV